MNRQLILSTILPSLLDIQRALPAVARSHVEPLPMHDRTYACGSRIIGRFTLRQRSTSAHEHRQGSHRLCRFLPPPPPRNLLLSVRQHLLLQTRGGSSATRTVLELFFFVPQITT